MANETSCMLNKLIIYLLLLICSIPSQAGEPDSVYLFAYATEKNGGRNGLHFAWSNDGKNWVSIGNEYSFLRSDYGRWGSQKRMIAPVLFQTSDGWWHCIWALNEEVNQFAHAASKDLINWGRQSYPYLQPATRFAEPVVQYNPQQHIYTIAFSGSASKRYIVTTKDFKNYSSPVPTDVAARLPRQTIFIGDGQVSGTSHRVHWGIVEALLKEYQSRQYRSIVDAEDARKDSVRFAGMKSPEVVIKAQPSLAKPISNMLIGVFFEDINYAADGGLYAELVQNRDFEYMLSDKEGRDTSWHNKHSWSVKGVLEFNIDSVSPIHVNNRHYAVLTADKPAAGSLVNNGFDGIAVKATEKYRFSVFLRRLSSGAGVVTVKLVTKDGEVVARSQIKGVGGNWKKYSATLVPNKTVSDLQLELQMETGGTLAVDMVSLFPVKTFKGRSNGLREDLARAIADIKPRFVRFPGGCVAHGDGLGNIYRWKNTIGPLEARVPQRNLWGYHQTAGLGYFEYFQFCEDIGAEPLPVLAAGVPCQNSGTGGGGQQGGIPMEEMNEYVQDVLDLIEYANGDVKTKWGKKRAEAGHPEPFNLKYIGIGNEDLITDVFEERYLMIIQAVKAKYPSITVIGTVGPFFEGADYREGWEIANREKLDMVDEHYYQSPGWFINNQDFYDSYDRSRSKVYLGEYASRGTTLYNALAEALYLTGLERNGDVVTMSSYAPLLAKEGHTQWNPDLIYFNNTEVKPTISYEIQKLYGNNSGDVYIPATLTSSLKDAAAIKRIGSSIVKDAATGDLIIKLINLLPVEASVKLELEGVTISSQDAVKTVVKGIPTERKAATNVTSLKADGSVQDMLPAYSFTVIRVKEK